jgi:uncharacterized integral membrane protein
MRYFLWLLKFALFVLILSFAVKNTETVVVRYYLGQEWQAPLVLVLLAFFCLGVAVGIVASLGHLFRQRRQIAALKSELRGQRQDSAKAVQDKAPDTA